MNAQQLKNAEWIRRLSRDPSRGTVPPVHYFKAHAYDAQYNTEL
jgi:hypothetical protein